VEALRNPSSFAFRLPLLLIRSFGYIVPDPTSSVDCIQDRYWVWLRAKHSITYCFVIWLMDHWKATRLADYPRVGYSPDGLEWQSQTNQQRAGIHPASSHPSNAETQDPPLGSYPVPARCFASGGLRDTK